MNFFKKSLSALSKTKNNIKDVFSRITTFKKINKEDLELIEECLLSADIGWKLTESIISQIKEGNNDYESWNQLLINALKKSIKLPKQKEINKVIIVTGINGSGKTTTSAKLAKYYKDKNKQVTLVAADTYRAAAIDQLKIWAERLNIDLVSNQSTLDPASVAFDGTNSGISKVHNHIIIDTAGRLHTSKNLMNELEKIYRIVRKLTDEISVVMTLDANIGQNGINQVKEFNKFLPIDNIILNKMDGTAKGGIVLPILNELKIPISFIGIGESYDDLIPFDFDEYLNLLIKE